MTLESMKTLPSFWILHTNPPEVREYIDFAKTNIRLKIHDIEHQQLFERPVRVHLRKRALGDVVLWGIVSIVLISDRLRCLLESIDATGYELIPANVKLIFPHTPQEAVYWQLIVNGWGGVASTQSGIQEIAVKPGFVKEYSIPTDTLNLIDANQYDGSDFFRVWPYPSEIVVTERVVRLFKEMHIQYCGFYPLANELNVIKRSTVTASTQALPLSLYYRPERAEEIGKTHGIDWYDVSISMRPYPQRET